ncbi:uncharacterized protein LOC130547239 [Triplophysa rosa]|uniref:ZP domain-containing protein n=1 Tax=Triplophysa rosa TaxID=992332 RepID=A0A9W7T9L8_TRIRA|nr:uncharacterized protein LOC130547239 [Triplophysa rosa]KAI7792546.1 hypothetical protein IRJ41_018927 [Triplophysa rosa]
MAVYTHLLALLLLATTAMASHFYGGSMTFNRRQTSDGSYKVDIRFKAAYHVCDQSDDWYCSSGNCGTKTSYASGRIDSSPNGGSWCQTEAVMTRTLTSNLPFQLRKDSCCWIYNVITGGGNWRLLTTIDLGVRSDTSQPNRSPVATTLPIVRVPQNCPRNYNLLSCDPDKDQVRCRYGLLSANECGMCNQHTGFTLDENTCTLSYRNTSTRGIYGFELVMEDYPTKNISLRYSNNSTALRVPFSNNPSIQPLSKIPLQFSLEVEAPAPSCVEGHYMPRFIHPTPAHGEHLPASVNQELEIRIKATAIYTSIVDVVISGPLNSTKEVTTSGEYVINWTPTADNLGQHFPFCFIAEAAQNVSRTYQSEMRCVIVVVGRAGPKADVVCTKDIMSVTVERANISGIHGNHLRLNDPSCLVTSNDTHVFANFSLNACGTQMEETDEHLIFKNEIVTYDDPRDIITRRHEVEIEVMCKYHKQSSITAKFDAHRPAVNITERGFGTFSYQFEFYESGFTTRKSPNSYPLEYEVGQTIYMQISPINLVKKTELFLESCSAKPYDNPSYPISYPIIANGCKVDSTVKFLSSHQSSVKFSMDAFKFIGQFDQVFITCSIIICEANNPYTRCAQGCTNGSVPLPSSHVHKREAPMQTASHFISQGPLRLRRSSPLTEFASPSLNLNLMFVAGCLLAVVGMVCGVVVYKSRTSKINYQRLKSDEI